MKGWSFSFPYISTFFHKIIYAQFGNHFKSVTFFFETHGYSNPHNNTTFKYTCGTEMPTYLNRCNKTGLAGVSRLNGTV